MTSWLTWLQHPRGMATVGAAALLVGGVGLAPAFSAATPHRRVAEGVLSGCLSASGDREVFNVVAGPARRKSCPAGSTRVFWRVQGPTGADGATGATGAAGHDGGDGAAGAAGPTGPTGPTGAMGPTGPAGADGAAGADGSDGTDGADGSDGADGADGAAGADGVDGAAGPGSLVSSGVFTLVSSSSFPDTFAYLPLTGHLSTQVVAPWLNTDAEVTEALHTSVEQVIGQDETITDIYAHFGSSTDLGGHVLTVELTLLVSSGGTALLHPAAGCIFAVEGNGPTSHDCALPVEQAVHLQAGDTAVLYLKPYVTGWEPNVPIEVYGSVALVL